MPSLKPDRIAGVGGLATRHDSMAAGEAGADYVLFGEPDAKGQRPSAEAIAERLQWWEELFEPPCVGFAVSREEAGEFAAAGADFVLVGDFIWADPRGAKAALIDVEQAIKQAHAAAPEKPRLEKPKLENQGRAGIAPDMKLPASDIDPRELADAADRRIRANFADAARRAAPASRRLRRKRRPKPKAADVGAKKPARQTDAFADTTPHRRPPSTIPMSISSTAPISAGSTRRRSISRPRARNTPATPRR